MFAFKINDGVTESVDELFALPEEEVDGQDHRRSMPRSLSRAAATRVHGTSQTPGNYAVVCFVPVGSVGETEGDGPPHFTEGMVHEFTVTS